MILHKENVQDHFEFDQTRLKEITLAFFIKFQRIYLNS